MVVIFVLVVLFLAWKLVDFTAVRIRNFAVGLFFRVTVVIFVDVFFLVDKFFLVLEIFRQVVITDLNTHFVIALCGLARGQ